MHIAYLHNNLEGSQVNSTVAAEVSTLEHSVHYHSDKQFIGIGIVTGPPLIPWRLYSVEG